MISVAIPEGTQENREVPRAEGTMEADMEGKFQSGNRSLRSCNPKTLRMGPADSNISGLCPEECSPRNEDAHIPTLMLCLKSVPTDK